MKRTIKLSIWTALIVLVSQVNATDHKLSMNVNMVGAKAFELVINDLQGEVKISLLHSKGGMLYNEKFAPLSNGFFKRTFDLGLFPDGDYIIELKDDEKKQSLPLSIIDNKLTVNTAEKTIHFLPSVYKKDNLVRVNMAAFDDEYLEISILDAKDELVFATKLKGKESFGKVFDFSKTNKGAYQFLLSSKAGFISKEIVFD